MADYNSELPIRSQLPGQVLPDDVIVKLGDATNPTTQLASVDTNGSQSTIIKDTSGNAVTTEANGAQRALDVMTQASGSATGGTAANFSELAGGIYNSTPPTLTNGQQASLQLDSHGRLLVDALITSLGYDTNYGTVGANTLRTAAQIGNATGSADFNAGNASAQTLRVVIATNQSAIPVTQSTSPWVTSDLADGSVNGGTAGTKSLLGGGIYNSTPLTLTNGQQASLQLDASGYLDVDLKTPIPAGTNLIGAVNVDIGGSPVSPTNPLPVTVVSALSGNSINDYLGNSAVAAGASVNHTYNITSGKTWYGKKVWASGSGKVKVVVQVSPDGVTYSKLWVGFNSTATPNITIDLDQLVFIESGAGATVQLVLTNLDVSAFDIHSTISGTEM